ncbi:UV-damaged DNA-binding protein rad7 [Conoideocrella luteorostrata]|uniref:UV-damaged DNA-binding protein rad7 n=1 Tax=Conoideocrella luteorostrata TaxID=1105319 RepID=A0AAJ0CVJ3_9HYPO|nr:UV-damaged DNA-binding protein rad7 [Conoideocrella luteorostrata]
MQSVARVAVHTAQCELILLVLRKFHSAGGVQVPARRSRAQNQNQGESSRPTRNITGPQSALTDFLASHNISARQIRDDAELRRMEANNRANLNGETPADEVEAAVAESSRGRRQSNRGGDDADDAIKSNRKKNELKTIEKIKASKSFQKRKKHAEDSDDEDEIARAIFEARHAPLPGQMENCAICDKRFTVTPYSVAGPDGGLLCAPCGREIAKERQGPQPKKKPRKQTGGIGSRRNIQSRILDGDVGTKSLATLCVQTLAKNVDMAESLGDLPEHLIDKIARIFSKRRLLRSETLPLFAQPTTESIKIYDGANLRDQDFVSIFQVAPSLRQFKARSAIQFKDEVMDYLLSRNIALESFYLHGANLLSEDKWHEFFVKQGQTLKGVQVYYTDKHFGDDSIDVMATHNPNLIRLKIENNQSLTGKGVESIGNLSALEHLGLQLQNSLSSASINTTVSKIGPKLKTLSLKIVPKADDTVLQTIHESCRSLTKLRITDSERMTDQGFVHLFKDWENPPLQLLDLQKCRYVDASRPRLNDENIGLCSEGFKALMAHSGQRLVDLNVHACRHISQQAFEEVFHQTAVFPELRRLEISFCEEITDFLLGSIFRACPKIREVNVFGCMRVKEVRVPRGVILVGVPNAQGMITEGT